MVRIRLTDPAFTDDFEEFLRRCQCVVDRIGRGTLAVSLSGDVGTTAALAAVRSGCCYRCAAEITEPLARLGSPLCLDCRDGLNDEVEESANGLNKRWNQEWLRMEVGAYLRVWAALHPESGAELIG